MYYFVYHILIYCVVMYYIILYSILFYYIVIIVLLCIISYYRLLYYIVLWVSISACPAALSFNTCAKRQRQPLFHAIDLYILR